MINIKLDVEKIFQQRLAESMGLDKYRFIMENIQNTDIPSFENIITYLYENIGNLEPSFASKMLATILPDKPIWDRYVVQNLQLKLEGKTKQEKLKHAVKLYEDMEQWYLNFLQTDKARECVEIFDRTLPDYQWLSEVKKVDCILWSIR